jgi:hypothetical protein
VAVSFALVPGFGTCSRILYAGADRLPANARGVLPRRISRKAAFAIAAATNVFHVCAAVRIFLPRPFVDRCT